MVIAIVGSSKFKPWMLEKAKELELEGNVAILSHLFSHADGYELTEDQFKNAVQNGHDRIDMCEMLYVVAPDNYIGESTQEEIDYAKKKGKIIKVWTGPDKEV